jgi:hypothetical protein
VKSAKSGELYVLEIRRARFGTTDNGVNIVESQSISTSVAERVARLKS